MKNPESKLVLVTDVPTLIFSGTGTIKYDIGLDYDGTFSLVFGDETIVNPTGNPYSSAGPLASPLAQGMKFTADAKVYAVCPSGKSTHILVTRWF